MGFSWKNLPRPIVALSPMADMTDSAFCQSVRIVNERWGLGPVIAIPSPSTPPPLLPELVEGHGGSAQGITDRTVVFREMVSSEAVTRGSEKTLGMTDIHPAERPLVQQLFGSEPETMGEAARIIYEQHKPEAFDINMGCPVYKIVHNFNGAALMKDAPRAQAIIRAIKAAVPNVPVSVKIRTGWSDPRECLEFAPKLEEAGAELITVHGRTKLQGYSGSSNWEMIAEMKKRVSIPVLANGDAHTAQKVVDCLTATGCDGVLVARGALGNPWIFAQTDDLLNGRPMREVTLEERLRTIREHAKLHLQQYGEDGLVSFRKHLTWYFKGQHGAKELRGEMNKVSDMASLEAFLGVAEKLNAQYAE